MIFLHSLISLLLFNVEEFREKKKYILTKYNTMFSKTLIDTMLHNYVTQCSIFFSKKRSNKLKQMWAFVLLLQINPKFNISFLYIIGKLLMTAAGWWTRRSSTQIIKISVNRNGETTALHCTGNF